MLMSDPRVAAVAVRDSGEPLTELDESFGSSRALVRVSVARRLALASFDEKRVLDGISFRLAHGETKALFGVAGSGKSTILKLALGLIRPDSGHIYTLGEDVTQMEEEQLFELRRKKKLLAKASGGSATHARADHEG